MPTCIITGELVESKFKIDTHELAWAAGFMDGEGTSSVVIKEKINPVLRITLPQKGKPLLKRFKKAILNQGVVWLRSNTAWGPVFVFQSQTFQESQAIIALLWKYLGDAKKQQYIKAYKAYMENYKGDLSHRMWGGLNRKGNIRGKIKSANPSPALLNAAIVAEVNSLPKVNNIIGD